MSDHSPLKPKIACFGEIIWDLMPHGLFIGGAPYNVAYHLTKLGEPTTIISAVGQDELGKIALEKAAESGIDATCIQVSDTLETGVSEITIENDEPSYEIRNPAAWDDIECTQLLLEKLQSCTAFVFGTLAARSEVSRATLFKLIDSFHGLTLCDVNLRKPYDDRDFALSIASKAEVIKLNEDELYRLTLLSQGSVSLEQALSELKTLTNARMIFLTRGKDPAVYFDGERLIFASPPSGKEVADTVGAGDAFTAAILQGLLLDTGIENCLERGVRLGSYVASQSGAQPDYEPVEALAGAL